MGASDAVNPWSKVEAVTVRVRFGRMALPNPRIARFAAAALEVVGFSGVAVGVHQVYPPAALIFAGAALVFIAQGTERRE